MKKRQSQISTQRSEMVSRQQSHKNLLRGMASQIRQRGKNDNANNNARNYRLMLRKALVAARGSVPEAEYAAFFEKFKRQTLVERNIVSAQRIGSDFMNGMIEGQALPLEQEIAWCAERIVAFAPEINEFITASRPLEVEIWSGEYASAIKRLDELEERFGTSMWQLPLRIALEQQANGLEAQKAYVASLRSIHKVGIIPYVAYHFSVRNEPNVTWSWYVDDTKRRLDNSRFSAGLKTYFRFHFIRSWPKLRSDLSAILRYEQSHSNGDIYETFLSFCQHVASTKGNQELAACVKQALEKLHAIKDPRLQKVRLYLEEGDASLAPTTNQPADQLLRGATLTAYKSALRALKSAPTRSNDMLVAAFARAARGSNNIALESRSLLHTAIANLAAVFGRGANHQAALDSSAKLAANLSATAPGRAIAGVVASEGSSEVLRPLPGLRLFAMNCDEVGFPDARAGLELAVSDDLASSYFTASFDNTPAPKGTEPFAAELMGGIARARSQDWAEAADAAAKVRGSRHEGLRRRATLLEMNARVRLDEVDPVVASIEHEISVSGIAPSLLPHVDLIDGKSWSELKPSANRLGLSIALDLALKATGSDRIATHRRFAYDAFLAEHHVDRASQLEVERFDKGASTYFLKNVAVPSVLDMSDALESTRAIQEERREVLSILTAIDPENASEYQDEILDITDQLALAEGLKIVDSSRIHVDTDAIETWAVRELSDGYRRYRTLVESGIGVAEDFDLVLTSLKKGEEKGRNPFFVPANEADDLLISIVRQLLDKFLYDPAHGLDSYLSRRIRHGSIVGFLRGPVEEAKIVSLRDENDSTYAPNTYWLEQLCDLSENQRASVSMHLQDFARSYDNALIRLRDELIQLKDKEHPNGLIDMRLYADVYHLIRSANKETGSFALFVATCFASFWGLLDRYLVACRLEIASNLRASLAQAFDNLRGNVNQIYEASVAGPSYGPPVQLDGIGELTLAITAAQTNLQAALEDVQTWFARSEVKLASRIYTLSEALNIAIQSALSRLRSYRPKIDLICDDDIGVPAEDLSTIAEIILVTLTNACEHSGVDGDTNVGVTVQYSAKNKYLTFVVCNEVVPSRRTPAILSRVNNIRTEIAAGSATAAVRKDRRSGLRKLGALKKRFERGDLSFGFTPAGTFELRFTLPFEITQSAPAAEKESTDVDCTG